tara:strand:+ start:2801 stop:4012 length:1212 start_codon:yes stop_codon:yes gene_type:complete
MGSIRRVIKKVTRAVKKPVSKAFKGVAKGIMKVGKATMRGIARINKKLGPLGSVALAIAMPYALGGLSTGTTALMNSQNAFLRSIGTIGNQIRTGYQAFNTGVSKTFNTITKSISQGFKKFAPKNIQNTYKSISEGAKNLFNSAKKVTQKYSPIKGKQGTVEVFGTADPGVSIVSSTDAARAIEAGTLDVSQIGKQTLGSDKWFVQGSKQTDKIITDTINDAYKSTLDTFSPDAKRYFNDLKSRASDIKTYVNDAEIGSAVENSVASSKYGTADGLDVIDVDLMKTGDYSSLNEEGTEFLFNGNKTYSADPVKDASSKLGKTIKQSAFKYAKGLLKPSDEKISPYTIAANQDMTMQTSTGGYGGTEITGTAGGDFFTKVYGEDAGRRIKNYYKNMNLIGSMTI